MNEFLQFIGAITTISIVFGIAGVIFWSFLEIKSLQKKHNALESFLITVECKAMNTQQELRKLLNKLELEKEDKQDG